MSNSTDSTEPNEFNEATLLYSTIGAMIAGVLMTLLLQHLICGPRARTTNTRGRAGPIDALPPRPSPFPSVAARSRRGRPGITSMPGIASFVYSTIGIAYEKLGIFNKAIEYHTQHLAIAKEMGS